MGEITDKRNRLEEIFEEAIPILQTLDVNNVGMAWPADLRLARHLREYIKEEING